jgi:hypothetical protein
VIFLFPSIQICVSFLVSKAYHLKMKRSFPLIAIAILAIIVVVAIASARSQPSKKSTLTVLVSATPAPTQISLSQTYTDSSGKFSFRYPDGWNVKDQSVGPLRQIEVTSPNGFTIISSYGPSGVGGQCENDPNESMGQDQVTMLGQTVNIFFVGDKSKESISSAYLLNSPTPCNNIPFVTIPATKDVKAGLAKIEMYYGFREDKQSADFTSQDYQTGKKILNSVTMK